MTAASVIPTGALSAQWRDLFWGCAAKRRSLGSARSARDDGNQCFRFGISVRGTIRMPAASSPSRTAFDTMTAVGPSP